MNDIARNCLDVNRDAHGHTAAGYFIGQYVHAHGMTEAQAISKAAEQMRQILREYKATCIANIRARYPNFKQGKAA